MGYSIEFREYVGSDQSDEQAAQRAPAGDGEIEGCQITRRWTRARQFTVADHAHDEQGEEIDSELYSRAQPDGRNLDGAGCRSEDAGSNCE